MSDFLNYWDTRIDANERFFNNYPHIANFAFSECQALWDHMKEERNALLARHNALVEAVAWERKAACAYNAACASDGYGQMVWATENLRRARAEVDRLLGEG